MGRLLQKIKILLIDDDKDLCETIKKILEYESYAIKYVFNGMDGIELIKSENFHLLLLDIKMPEMDGIEVIKKINEINTKIGVIILTGYPSIESAIETLKNKAYDYITKPFSNENLVKVVKDTIKKMGLLEDPQNRLNCQLGKNVKNFRMIKNMTIRDLAKKTGLSVGLISQIENGKNAASMLTLYKLSQILDVKLSELVANI